MSKYSFVYGLIAGALLFGIVTTAMTAENEEEGGVLHGGWSLYSGSMGDERFAPKIGDAKVAMMVDGPLAIKMWTWLGPQSEPENACGKRERMRGNLDCVRDMMTPGDAQCYFGFDLSSGRSISGIVC